MKFTKPLLAFSIVCAATISLPAFADEIEDAIAEALQAYQDREFTAAGQALSYASQLILQKSASTLSAILPPPLPGWDAKKSETQATDMAMMGGGIQASSGYTEQSDTVEIQTVGDSPLPAQWVPMISDPAMGVAVGAKIERIGKQRGLPTKDGEVMLVVDKRFLVTIGRSAAKETKTEYGQAIDFAALEGL